MLAGEQCHARRRTDGMRIILGETRALGGELIKMRGFDSGMTIGGQIPVAEIVRQDENNVRPRWVGVILRSSGQRGQKRNQGEEPKPQGIHEENVHGDCEAAPPRWGGEDTWQIL